MKRGVRTDLAVEIRESLGKAAEIPGVELEHKTESESNARISLVRITNKEGQRVMRKPIGTYITIETDELTLCEDRLREQIAGTVSKYLLSLVPEYPKNGVLVMGLGNRDITPDALGPLVAEKLPVTRHLQTYDIPVAAFAPGVMGQTGMEASEILRGVVLQTKPDLVIVIDALAARSTTRLNRTVQMTDTGICPGAGVGNRRKEINQASLFVPVIAIGVPTVIDATTIVRDKMEHALQENGLNEEEIEQFLTMLPEDTDRMYVTPKDVDEAVRRIAEVIAEAIDQAFSHPKVGEAGY